MSHDDGRKPRIFTVCHSDMSINSFLSLMEKSSVRVVADVRSNPASARFPHFERRALAHELEKFGIVYRWFRDLGGRRPPTHGEEYHTSFEDSSLMRYAAAMNTSAFMSSVQELVGIASSAVTAIMCAERNPDYCHRLLLADKLEVEGARVVHILDNDTDKLHSRHPDLVVEDHHLIYRKRQLNFLD